MKALISAFLIFAVACSAAPVPVQPNRTGFSTAASSIAPIQNHDTYLVPDSSFEINPKMRNHGAYPIPETAFTALQAPRSPKSTLQHDHSPGYDPSSPYERYPDDWHVGSPCDTAEKHDHIPEGKELACTSLELKEKREPHGLYDFPLQFSNDEHIEHP